MQQHHPGQTTSGSILVGVSTKMYLGYQDSLDWLEQLGGFIGLCQRSVAAR